MPRTRLGRLAPIVILVVSASAPLAVCAQGADAKAAYQLLRPKAGSDGFLPSFSAESARLPSIDDAAWLAGALAADAKDASQRKFLLAERGSLLELLGRYSDAAAAWESAATAVPGVADAPCLLSAAACRLVAGEAEAAAGLATAVAFSSPDPYTAKLAALVSGWASLARGDRDAASLAAKAAASDPDPRVSVPALLLGRASSRDDELAGYEKRLEALRSRPEATSSVPLLLVIGSTARGAQVEDVPSPPAAASAAPVSPPAPGQGGDAGYYQVGAFKDEENAAALVKKLESLGLRVLSKRRGASGLFVVYVEAGPDAAKTVLVLKDAGYEAWAIDGKP
ncbi:MAG: SPOR domain-containing protein [Spirochaetes bacterium]|nr:SPOR domain-containing protein [Spirochaetota bacterium]MBU1080639.1 SPOR domain-containing protein [Spirochaetota bacterium]